MFEQLNRLVERSLDIGQLLHVQFFGPYVLDLMLQSQLMTFLVDLDVQHELVDDPCAVVK